jgi:hypothetical protein
MSGTHDATRVVSRNLWQEFAARYRGDSIAQVRAHMGDHEFERVYGRRVSRGLAWASLMSQEGLAPPSLVVASPGVFVGRPVWSRGWRRGSMSPTPEPDRQGSVSERRVTREAMLGSGSQCAS